MNNNIFSNVVNFPDFQSTEENSCSSSEIKLSINLDFPFEKSESELKEHTQETIKHRSKSLFDLIRILGKSEYQYNLNEQNFGYILETIGLLGIGLQEAEIIINETDVEIDEEVG